MRLDRSQAGFDRFVSQAPWNSLAGGVDEKNSVSGA